MNRWNAHDDKLTDVAYAVRQRTVYGGQRYEVYVRDNGSVAMVMQGTKQRRHPLPTHCLVGTYDRAATTADIACDLAERAKELGA